MAFRNPFIGFTKGGLFIFILAVIASVQIFSMLISTFFKTVPIFKGGQLLIIVSIFLTFILLTKVIFKGSFERMDLLFIVLMGAVTWLLFTYGGIYFPKLFSIFGDQAITSARSLASTIGLP